MAVLITGGTGYIGSHTSAELLNAGEELILLDNFSNSKPEVLDALSELTGKNFKFYEADLLDLDTLLKIFRENEIEAVIHFAGKKAVGESVSDPIMYYENNVAGTLNLCKAMKETGCRRIVFSSSATVYGDPDVVPIEETAPMRPANPYGRTKLMIEEILKDLAASDGKISVMLLRYFNPIGAHESGKIGENPTGIPNNLMPYICQTAAGKRERLNVFGGDYPTPDGTCIRDYIHVCDLAEGHRRALDYIRKNTGADAVNLGTGRGYSVLDVIRAFENATGIKIPYQITDRRPGDVPSYFANPKKAKELFGWEARLSLEEMCRSSWEYTKGK